MIVKDLLINKIEKVFDKLGLDKSLISIAYSSKPEAADYQLNSCFALAKKLGKNPTEIAKAIVEELNKDSDFIFELSMPAFINIKLTNKSPKGLILDIKLSLANKPNKLPIAKENIIEIVNQYFFIKLI